MNIQSINNPVVSWDGFRDVEWDVLPGGEIITDRPEYIPFIKEFLVAKSDADALRALYEKYGGTWIENPR